MNVAINKIKPNPKNPRTIKDDKFNKLVKSIQEFPQMLEKRPLVCFTDTDGMFVVLGGNMRLKAAKEVGLKELPILLADDWTEEQKQEFLIKDNVGFGEWNWEELHADWDVELLDEWGLDVPNNQTENDIYTTKVDSPTYEIKGEKPEEEDLYNLGKYNQLMDKITNSDVDEKTKLFLQMAATRHIVFDYGLVAEFYAHTDEKTQELMEDSALVIIDYNKAIELGFVKLFGTLEALSETDE
jgi:hypothetical protein